MVRLMVAAVLAENYPDWLREQRDLLVLTQAELAEQLGVSVRAIQAYEAGEAFPRAARRRKIAAFFADQQKGAA